MFGTELERLDTLAPFEPTQAPGLRIGQKILLTASISDMNPLLFRNLVVACEEKQEMDSVSWQTRKQYHCPLLLTRDSIEYTVTLRHGYRHRSSDPVV